MAKTDVEFLRSCINRTARFIYRSFVSIDLMHINLDFCGNVRIVHYIFGIFHWQTS